MPQAGCPNTPEVTWQTGWVLQDMVKESGYAHSKSFHLKSDLRDDIKRFFCMKTKTSTKGKNFWQPGKIRQIMLQITFVMELVRF